MITLMTGVPGTGKTAHIVAQLLKEKTRPLFVMGIPDLKVPHTPVPPIDHWTERRPDPDDPSVMLPYFTFPKNSIVVIDEAQRIYRPRPVSSKVPDIVAAFETHRHTGVDFWLLTQGPSLLDSNIRRLVTKHWHIHPTPFGRRLLEWSQCRNPENKSDRSDALSTSYKPDSKVFPLYKSAELHTVVKRSIPKSFVVAVVSLFLALGLGTFAYNRISKRVTSSVAQVESPSQNSVVPSAPVPPVAVSSSVGSYLDTFQPVHPDFPESAPAYDSLRVVKAMPVVAGCIQIADACQCYSQQGTKLDIQRQRCSDIVQNKVFDPYRESIHLAQWAEPPSRAQPGSGSPAVSNEFSPVLSQETVE
jgi:zona occludens toxin